jgi:hypothetical protein
MKHIDNELSQNNSNKDYSKEQLTKNNAVFVNGRIGFGFTDPRENLKINNSTAISMGDYDPKLKLTITKNTRK